MKALLMDVGGTHINYAITDFNSNNFLFKTKFQYDGNNPFIQILGDISKTIKIDDIDILAICAAGPLVLDKIKLSNSNLIIDKHQLETETRFKKILLCNDLEALARGVLELSDDDLVFLNAIKPQKNTDKCLVSVGTGLGKAFFSYDIDKAKYDIIKSEGGHSLFPFKLEGLDIQNYIYNNYNLEEIEEEDLISGRGLERIYSYLSRSNFSNCSGNLSSKEISESFDSNECSKETFTLFMKFLGRVCRSYVLTNMSTGGVYLAGGVIQKNVDNINYENFINEFTKDSRFKSLLEKVPIVIVKDYDTSLLGLKFLISDLSN